MKTRTILKVVGVVLGGIGILGILQHPYVVALILIGGGIFYFADKLLK